MKMFLFLPTLLCATLASAQDYQNMQGMSQQDMQKMMGQMQKMQTCMQGVDQAELEAFGRRGEQMEREVRALCDNGKRDAAQDKAMAFGREVQQNQAMQQMARCSQMMAGMVPQPPFLKQVEPDSISNRHICDN